METTHCQVKVYGWQVKNSKKWLPALSLHSMASFGIITMQNYDEVILFLYFNIKKLDNIPPKKCVVLSASCQNLVRYSMKKIIWLLVRDRNKNWPPTSFI